MIQTHGRHVLHFGAEFVHAAIAGGGPGRDNGEFSFGRAGSGQYTRGSLNARDGNSIADLLLGTPQSGFIDYNDSSYGSWPYWALYLPDYWNLAPKLTLNLGLRYDVQVPFAERFNRLNAGFDFSVKNPLSDQIIAKWNELKKAYDATHRTNPYPNPPAAIYGGALFAGKNKRRPPPPGLTDFQTRGGLGWHF